MSQKNTKNPAMILHELTVKFGVPPPQYRFENKTKGPDGEFRCEVYVQLEDVCGIGFGHFKLEAKRSAAIRALELLDKNGLYELGSTPAQEFHPWPGKTNKPLIQFLPILNNVCVQLKLSPPKYEEVSHVGPPHRRQFTYECKLLSVTTQGTARSKKMAKQLAARDMLDKFKDTTSSFTEKFGSGLIFCINTSIEKRLEVIGKYEGLSCTSTTEPTANRKMTSFDFNETLRRIMQEKNIKPEHFKEQFKNRNREGLDYIFNELGIKYNINVVQECPYIAAASFNLGAPFSILAIGGTEKTAISNLVGKIYVGLNVDLGLPGL